MSVYLREIAAAAEIVLTPADLTWLEQEVPAGERYPAPAMRLIDR